MPIYISRVHIDLRPKQCVCYFSKRRKSLRPKLVGNWSGMYFRRLYHVIKKVRIRIRTWENRWSPGPGSTVLGHELEFSLDGDDVPCPLQAPLAFTYRKEGGSRCLSPLSQGQGPSNTPDICWWIPILFLRGTNTRYIRYRIVHTNTEPILVYSGTGTLKEFPRKNGRVFLHTFSCRNFVVCTFSRLYLSYKIRLVDAWW